MAIVMQYWSAMVEREFSVKAKLLIYWSNYGPTLTSCHELWVVFSTVNGSDPKSKTAYPSDKNEVFIKGGLPLP